MTEEQAVAPAVITSPPLVNRTVPELLGPGVMREQHDSGSIEEDIQTGTITETWLLQGNPWEAREGPGMQGLQLKDLHRWYNGLDGRPAAFCTKRRLVHKTKSDIATERTSIGTFTYQLRPCPHAFEDEEIGTLISRLMWWSLDNPPLRITNTEVGWAIMIPSRLLIRRYLAVEQTRAQINTTMAELSKTNRTTFVGQPPGVWQFHDYRRKMLYGDAVTLDGVHEISLFFLGDPDRHHEIWTPRRVAGKIGNLMQPLDNSFAELRRVHKPKVIYSPSTIDFDDLVDISAVIGKCSPEP